MLVVAAAASALTIALGIDRVADRSWERTFEATNGAHATLLAPPGDLDVAAIERLPGVAASTGDVGFVQSDVPPRRRAVRPDAARDARLASRRR